MKYQDLQIEQRKERQRTFLKEYIRTVNVRASAAVAGINRQTHYDWLNDHPEYREQFAAAKKESVAVLIQEARRRAVEGVEKPVYHGGKLVGTRIDYSDVLLMFLIKGELPEKYRDHFDVRHTQVKRSVEFKADLEKLAKLSDEELNKLRSLLLAMKRDDVQDNAMDTVRYKEGGRGQTDSVAMGPSPSLPDETGEQKEISSGRKKGE